MLLLLKYLMLRELEEVVRFQDQIVEKKLRSRRIELRAGVVHFLVGKIHIHMGRVFLYLGLF